MAFKMKGHSLPGPHQRKSPTKHFEGLVHDHPHASDKKKTSKAMKRKIAEVKDANLKETNKILVSQGKDPVKAIPDSPATSKSPTKQGLIWGPKGGERLMDAFGGETKIEKDRRQKTYRKSGESKYKSDVRRKKEQSVYEKGLGKRKKKSPAKIAPLVMMGAQMLGKKMMEKKQENNSPGQQRKPNIKLMGKTGASEIKLMGKTGAAKPKTKMLKGTTVFGKTISERNEAFPFGQGPKIRKYAKKLRTGIQKLKKK